MALHKLNDEQAEDRLNWLLGLAGIELANLVLDQKAEQLLDSIPAVAIEQLHKISRVAATVAKHYEEKNA